MSIEEEYDEETAALYRKWVGRVQGFLIGMGCDHGLRTPHMVRSFMQRLA